MISCRTCILSDQPVTVSHSHGVGVPRVASGNTIAFYVVMPTTDSAAAEEMCCISVPRISLSAPT